MQPKNARKAVAPVVIEVDNENVKKDIEKLDISLPRITPRIYREHKDLEEIDVSKFDHQKVKYKQFYMNEDSDDDQVEIVFRDITTGEQTHITLLDTTGEADYRCVIGFFA